MEGPFTPKFLSRLQQLKIRTRRSFLGSRQGIHESIRRGQGLEFSDFRPYVPGDDYRHIDWGVYGRSDRLYVKQFRAEQDLNVLIMLDTSESMRFPLGERKFELARDVALALGYIALIDGDSVQFALLGKRTSPRFSGHRALGRAIAELRDVRPGGRVDLVREARAVLAAQRLPGRCFLLSDFLCESDSQFAVLDLLRSRNFEVTVIHFLAPGERRLPDDLPDFVEDAETGELLELALDGASRKEYALRLAEHVERLEKYCRSIGIAHLLISTDEDLADVVLSRFPASGVLH